MNFKEKRDELLKRWYEFEKTKAGLYAKLVFILYGGVCLLVATFCFPAHSFWYWVFYSQWLTTILPYWSRSLVSLCCYIGKLSGLTRYRKGTLLALRYKKFKPLHSVLYSTKYESVDEAFHMKLFPPSMLEDDEEADPKSTIDLGPRGEVPLDTVFMVIEDEEVDKNPFKFVFNPYLEGRRRVKVFTTFGTYWADPETLTKLKENDQRPHQDN